MTLDQNALDALETGREFLEDILADYHGATRISVQFEIGETVVSANLPNDPETNNRGTVWYEVGY